MSEKNKSMHIKCHGMTIEKLLDGSDFFKIPKFQRAYSWEADQLIDLWDDVASNDPDDYFLGSMVMYNDKDYLSIIDGQQRLTTIILFLCAVRNAMKKYGLEKLAKSLHQNYIEKTDKNGTDRFKLKTVTSSPFLQQKFFDYEVKKKIIKVSSAEEKSINYAYYFLDKKIAEELYKLENSGVPPEKLAKLIEAYLSGLRDKLIDLSIVFILMDNQDDAFQVFETLNTRGKDLEVPDLAKNYLSSLLKVKNDELDTVSSTWDEINQCFTNANDNLKLDPFFLYYWLSYKGNTITKKSLFKNFRKTVKKNNAEEYLASIKRHVEIFRFIHEPDFLPECFESYNTKNSDFHSLTNSLNGIKLFRPTMQLPLLLALFDKYSEKVIKWSHVESFVKKIEAFHFVYTAVTGQRSKTGVSEMYSKTAFKIRGISTSQDIQAILKSFMSGLEEFYPSKDQYLYDFQYIEYGVGNTKRKDLVRYILDKYLNEEVFTKGYIDTSGLSIEHFDSQANKAPYCCKIGNLLLLDKKLNSETLKDHKTEKKYEILEKNSNVWLTDSLINKQNVKLWSEQQVQDRTNHIAEALYDKILKLS